jgi:hypothetical protein
VHLTRRGATTVAELCVALVLGAIAAALGGSVLVAAERHARRDHDRGRASQTVREVAHLLGTELAAAQAGAITLRGDTAIDIGSYVGASVACRAAATEVILPPTTTTLTAPYTHWRQTADVGDQVMVWDTTDGGRWASSRIDSISLRTDGAGCPADGVFRTVADSLARRPVFHLQLSPPLPNGVIRGAPVRLFREARWMIYKAADRLWWLGTRRCSAACSAAQPVAGPLATPADSGLVFAQSPTGAVEIAIRAFATGDGSPPRVTRISAAPRGDSRARP